MNRKTLFFILFSLFYSLSCLSQDTLFFDAKWNSTSRKNATYFNTKKKQGAKWLWTGYFAKSGKLQLKGTLLSLTPEIRDGNFEWYFENGRLAEKGNYVNGIETGEYIWYDENGNIKIKINYLNGKHQYNYEEYYLNRKLKDKTSYADGLQSGWTEYYGEDGSKQSEGNYKNNMKDGFWTFYNQNGSKASEGNYKGDMRDGIWKFFDENGNLFQTDTIQMEYNLTKAKMFLQLPNDEWYLAVNEAPDHYIFKRQPITDSQGRDIIPAIMVYVVDAQKFNKNVQQYTNDILTRFPDLKITKTLKWGDKNYPLKYINALFLVAEYTQNDVGHILYLIHIINQQNTGIQIYLDMTKDIAEKCDPEFWTTINSIKEVN